MNIICMSEILNFIPIDVNQGINWDNLIATKAFSDVASRMEMTMQNPMYHSEGNVLEHTHLVVSALVSDDRFYTLSDREKVILFCAALYHDIGKIRTTVCCDGILTSPYHSIEGCKMCEDLIAVEPEFDYEMKKALCLLIRFHMTPGFLLSNREDCRLKKIQLITKSIDEHLDFNWKLLLLLCEADTRGRIANDTKYNLEKLNQVRKYLNSQEIEC